MNTFARKLTVLAMLSSGFLWVSGCAALIADYAVGVATELTTHAILGTSA